jgi:ankyrin repeat protein
MDEERLGHLNHRRRHDKDLERGRQSTYPTESHTEQVTCLSDELRSMKVTSEDSRLERQPTRTDDLVSPGMKTQIHKFCGHGAKPKTPPINHMDFEKYFAQDDDGDNPLMVAIIHGRRTDAVSMIRLAQEKGKFSLLDITNYDFHQSALHLSTLTKQTTLVKALVDAGAQLYVQDRKGNTPLHNTVRNDDLDSFRVMSRHLVKPLLVKILKTKNFDGETCLHIAAKQGSVQMVEEILKQAQIDINMKEGKNHETILHIAVEREHLCLLMFLLHTKIIDVEARTMSGNTALAIAKGNNLRICTQLLLSAGADHRSVNDSSKKEDNESKDDVCDDDVYDDDDEDKNKI